MDEGNKWSPIFGRYAFIMPMDGGEGEVRVGDEVVVTKRNEVRDKWCKFRPASPILSTL